MRSIFWIGCILAVLVSLLASGAIAASMDNSTVPAANAADANVTAAPEKATASENVTDVKTNVTASAEINGTNVSAVKPAAEPDLVNDTLVKFVTDARTFAVNSGKSAALATFNNPSGGFVNDKMYIFAYDMDGKALALPYDLGAVGKNQIARTDSTGLRYVQQMVDTAKSGVGFVKYQEPNLLASGVVMKKVSYVTNVDGTYFIGAGVYMTPEDKKAAAAVPATKAVNATADVNATTPAVLPSLPAEAVNTTASNSTA